MFTLDWLALPNSRLLTLTLLHFVWQGFAVAILLAALVELCRVRRSAARYACSLAALLVMTIAPLATLVSLSNTQRIVSDEWFSGQMPAAPLPLNDLSWRLLLEQVEPYLLAAWLIGVALFGSRLLAGAYGVARLRHGRLTLPPDLKNAVARLGNRLKINALPLVFLSRQAADAMAIGLVRPLVLIPASWATEMPLEMLEAVIAHELAHLARRDLWVNLLQRVVETLLFYHPAVWWLSRRLRIERELCADERAVAATGKRLEYAQTLEHIATERQADIRPALAAFLRGETDMRLLQRVRNVLNQAPAERSRIWPAGLAALALPLGLWLAAAYSNRATADDDEKKPAIKRERQEREEIKHATTQVLERNSKDAKKVDEIKKRIADELKRGEEREVKKSPRGEEVEERVIIRRDPARSDERIEKKIVTVDGKPRVEVEVARKDEPDRKPAGDRRLDELTALVKRLTERVERLQDEVSQLRGQKSGDKASSQQRSSIVPDKRLAAERRDLDVRKREVEQAERVVEEAANLVDAADSEVEAKLRILAEQKAALADRAARRNKGTLEHAVRPKNEAAAEQKRQAEQAQLKAREAREKAELKFRDALEKALGIEHENEEHARDEQNRAQEKKEQAVRKKIIEEKKQLEEKIKSLKNKDDKNDDSD